MTVTKRMLSALQWFADQTHPVGAFDRKAPTRQMRAKLEKLGFIEVAGPTRNFEFIKYRISQAGTEALNASTV